MISCRSRSATTAARVGWLIDRPPGEGAAEIASAIAMGLLNRPESINLVSGIPNTSGIPVRPIIEHANADGGPHEETIYVYPSSCLGSRPGHRNPGRIGRTRPVPGRQLATKAG